MANFCGSNILGTGRIFGHFQAWAYLKFLFSDNIRKRVKEYQAEVEKNNILIQQLPQIALRGVTVDISTSCPHTNNASFRFSIGFILFHIWLRINLSVQFFFNFGKYVQVHDLEQLKVEKKIFYFSYFSFVKRARNWWTCS